MKLWPFKVFHKKPAHASCSDTTTGSPQDLLQTFGAVLQLFVGAFQKGSRTQWSTLLSVEYKTFICLAKFLKLFPHLDLDLRGGFQKNHWICEHAHTSLGPPPNCEHLRLFFLWHFLDYWGCLVHCETDFVKFWVKLYKNYAKEGRPKEECRKLYYKYIE